MYTESRNKQNLFLYNDASKVVVFGSKHVYLSLKGNNKDCLEF